MIDIRGIMVHSIAGWNNTFIKRSKVTMRWLKLFILALILIPAGNSVWAVTHIVKFGGSDGLKYVPASFSASVGDTVKWEGDFTLHPLSSTTIPANAQSWQELSGSSFSYVIVEPGNYDYQCDVHVSLGMKGSFQVGASGIDYPSLNPVKGTGTRIPLMVTGPPGKPFVTFSLPRAGPAALQIVDLHGQERATIFDRIMNQGTYTMPLTEMTADGIYCIRLNYNKSDFSTMLTVLH
jgi:plastocyanin